MDSGSLSPEERAGLRPTVDAQALERLLAVAPPESRPLILAVCARDPEPMGLLEPFPESEAGPRLTFLPFVQRDVMIAFDDPELQRLWEAVEPSKPR